MAATQVGTAMTIGYGGNTYTGYIMDDFEKALEADDEVIKGEDNETVDVILFDPKASIKFSALIKSTLNGGSITPPGRGTTITINTVAYRVTESRVQQSRSVAKLSVSAVKETSMTYT